MSVTAIYHVDAAAEKHADLLEILGKARDSAGAADGSEGFEIFQGKGDPHRLTIIERWSSADAHQQHFDENMRKAGVVEAAEALMAVPFPPPEDTHYLPR